MTTNWNKKKHRDILVPNMDKNADNKICKKSAFLQNFQVDQVGKYPLRDGRQHVAIQIPEDKEAFFILLCWRYLKISAAFRRAVRMSNLAWHASRTIRLKCNRMISSCLFQWISKTSQLFVWLWTGRIIATWIVLTWFTCTHVVWFILWICCFSILKSCVRSTNHTTSRNTLANNQ